MSVSLSARLKKTAVGRVQEPICVICIWPAVIRLAVTLHVGCVHVWESRGCDVLTVVYRAGGGGGGYREPRKAGVVVTSIQHTWQ